MDGLREYLIGVIAAALLCGITTSLTGTKGTVGTAIKLLSALLMLLAVVRPWADISFSGLFGWTDHITADGQSLVASGEAVAAQAYRTSIIQQTQAYILDEAKALNCDLAVEVILSDEEIPVPAQVRIWGDVSPYARQTLTNLMTERLGIKREEQLWM